MAATSQAYPAMLAVTFQGPESVEVKHVERPLVVAEHEVIVEVLLAGICGCKS